MDYQFQNPEFLWLLLGLPLLGFWQWYNRKREMPEMLYSSVEGLVTSNGNWVAYTRWILPVFRLLAIGSAIIGLARPRTAEGNTKIRSTEGIDIVMAIDISASMLARDLRPSRMKATKKVAADFINDRPNDRIGLVIYAGESYTQTPLTSDHRVLRNTLEDVKYGLIQDGTAIGMGLATSVSRLKDSKSKSKVIILLTDGENNSGQIDPLTAAQLAREFNIRVYTIGVGTKGTAPTPVAYDFKGKLVYRNLPVNIDEDLLKEIASQTGGQYFRATDNDKLQAIYKEIDQLEKTKLQELKYYSYDEKFEFFALVAFILIVLEILLKQTVFRSFI